MSSIADLPDDPKYTIKTVCIKTGIRPVTLRAWERRHDILSPHRSENRYRLYSDRDIALLRWIKDRVDSGLTISSAAVELRGMLKKGVWPDALPSAPTTLPVHNAIPPEQYSLNLYQALIIHNESRAADLLREAHSIFDLMTVCSQVIAPALTGIGDAWYRGEIRVTTEHFASAFLRGRLLSLMQAYPSRRNAPHMLVGCAPTEQHELGALMFSLLLRREGYRVEYLGPDLPLEDLADYAALEKPDMIILTATMFDAAGDLKIMPGLLKKVHSNVAFGFGGSAFRRNSALRQIVLGVYLGDTYADGLEALQTLFPVSPRNSDRTNSRRSLPEAS